MLKANCNMVNKIPKQYKSREFQRFLLIKSTLKNIQNIKVVQAICQKYSPSQLSLNLQKCKLGCNTKDVDILQYQFEYLYNLKEMNLELGLNNLGGNFMHLNWMKIAFDPLQNSLISLRISLKNNFLGEGKHDLFGLAFGLQKLKKLKKLTIILDYNKKLGLKGEQIELLMEKVKSLKELSYFQLSFTGCRGMNDMNIQMLFQNLRTLSKLTELELWFSENFLYGQQIKELAKGLSEMKNLKYLSLSFIWNNLGLNPEHFRILGEGLKNLQLEELMLDLRYNKISYNLENMKEIKNILVNQPQLKGLCLYLDTNQLGCQQKNMVYLRIGIENLRYLTQLQLSLSDNNLNCLDFDIRQLMFGISSLKLLQSMNVCIDMVQIYKQNLYYFDFSDCISLKEAVLEMENKEQISSSFLKQCEFHKKINDINTEKISENEWIQMNTQIKFLCW